jgi:small nuclear ribonucleoprotein (snRNP)-like protein
VLFRSPDDKQPVYDGWLSVGSTENQQISLSDGEQVQIQIISYYDDLMDFRFDPTIKQIEFTMPFDWNMTRLEENNLMVHQEITIPKQSDLASVSYIGKVNGIDVTKNLMLDDSNSTKNVIHFMLPKPVVMQIAEQVNNNGQDSNKLMQFSLEPSESIAPSTMASSHA